VVRRNALKHGLAAQVVVAFDEDAEAFRVMADAHLAAFRPRNDVELELVNTFSVAAWVRRQCVSAQTCMTNQYIRQGQAEEKLTSAEAAERIRRLAFDPRKEADKVRRYEDASIRRLSRACSDFIKLRESGVLDEDADAEPEFAIRPDAAKSKPAPGTGWGDQKIILHGANVPADSVVPSPPTSVGEGQGGGAPAASPRPVYRARSTPCRPAPHLNPPPLTPHPPRPVGTSPQGGEGGMRSESRKPGAFRGGTDARIDEATSPVDLPAWNPTSGLPRFAFDTFSSLLQGLLLLLCFWGAMSNGQGEALRPGPAPKAEVRVEPPAVTETDDRRSNSQTRTTSDTPTAQIKAMAICAGRRGGAGLLIVIAPREDARSFERRPRHSDRCAAKYPRRTKPRQSVRVARAPPFVRA